MKFLQFRRLIVLVTFLAVAASSAFAEKSNTAKLRVNVTPAKHIFSSMDSLIRTAVIHSGWPRATTPSECTTMGSCHRSKNSP